MGTNIDGGVGFVCECWCVQSAWTCVSVGVCKVLERKCKCLFVGVCVCLEESRILQIVCVCVRTFTFAHTSNV